MDDFLAAFCHVIVFFVLYIKAILAKNNATQLHYLNKKGVDCLIDSSCVAITTCIVNLLALTILKI